MMQSGPNAELRFSGNGWNGWVTMCMERFTILTVGFISFKCSGMFYHVDWCVVTDTLEAYVASKFRFSNIIWHSLKQMSKKLKFLGTFTSIAWLQLCSSFMLNIFKLLHSYFLSVMTDPLLTLLPLKHILWLC